MSDRGGDEQEAELRRGVIMRSETRVAPTLSSVAPARRWARDRLAAAGIAAERLDVLVLLVSELVTNALVHARPPVVVRVEVDDRRTRVEVADGSAASLPVVRTPPPTAAGGRGVQFVERLTTRWGTSHGGPDGLAKTVWFELSHDQPVLPVPRTP